MISQEILKHDTDLKPIDDIEEVCDQQDDECVEFYYEADSRKDLEVHDDGYNERRTLDLMVCRQVLNVRIVILNIMLKAIYLFTRKLHME